jgi:hypothetical protein
MPELIEVHATIVEGITSKFGFNPRRLEKHRAEIGSIVEKLPDVFWEGRGGGSSFLNACVDRHGHHWGEQRNVEQLMVLGIAIGKIEHCPREMWSLLPGEMPYITVKPEMAAMYFDDVSLDVRDADVPLDVKEMGKEPSNHDKQKAQNQYCHRTGNPHFAPPTGICWGCKKNIYTAISLETASTTLITGCPHCHKTFCG